MPFYTFKSKKKDVFEGRRDSASDQTSFVTPYEYPKRLSAMTLALGQLSHPRYHLFPRPSRAQSRSGHRDSHEQSRG